MKFGENLKIIRKGKNMSQEQLAEKVNVSRQSVSKWETGEAYPEMNNILELCKIFNCKINDLVHPEMSDISSLDEEIVMNVVKFNEKKQKEVKTLSKVINLIGKIGKIVLIVGISFIIFIMTLIPYIVNNVDVKNNDIVFMTDNIKLIDNDKIELFDEIILDVEELPKKDIINILTNNSKVEIICFLEGALLFIIISFIIIIFILNYVEKLFKNIKDNNTPFTLDNIKYIKRICYFMIALIVINPVSELLVSLLFDITEFNSSLELMSILEILILFSMSYIFEYGYEIQKDSNGKIYGDEVE